MISIHRFARLVALAVALIMSLLGGCAFATHEKMPDEEDFFLELLDPMPRSTSGSFHSYSEDSYSVDKINFWSEFPSFARDYGYNPKAVLVVGPIGILWTYYVFALIEEDKGVRINGIVFPHGRLTGKKTIVLSEAEALAWISKFESISGVHKVDSTPEALRNQLSGNDMGDFEFNLLLVQLDNPEEVFVANIPWIVEEGSEETGKSAPEQLEETLNDLVIRMEQTY